ncbi:MAG: hypothetical protein PHD76_00535 [Methylacidiphilales bacterium]|nr:hypothetical protein [Candidatus Methylacidiphilales bacterium]
MPVQFTDSEIQALLLEGKPLPADYALRVVTKAKRGHRERELAVEGEAGSDFVLKLRQSSINPLDFSVILCVVPKGKNEEFRLRRHNGKSHEHTNKLERVKMYDYHIHMATERYQRTGWEEDSYAEPTNRYQDFQGALQSMLQDANFILPANAQIELI